MRNLPLEYVGLCGELWWIVVVRIQSKISMSQVLLHPERIIMVTCGWMYA